ncbi:MAG: GNAT family N-acetyltransferase [Euryarchaeota archaeon]|nr:GNAT family N-acetyltransferase [Euryarchaeota archaeon]
MPVKVRRMKATDYDALVATWKAAGLPYRPKGRDSRENVERELMQGTSLFFVAEESGKVVGAVLGTQDGRKVWLNRMAVLPSHQKKGVGRMLADAVEKEMERLGIMMACALIDDGNDGSMKFFEGLGYVRHRDIYYFSKRKGGHV